MKIYEKRDSVGVRTDGKMEIWYSVNLNDHITYSN